MQAPRRQGHVLDAARAAVGFLPEPEALALFHAGEVAVASGLGPLVEIGAYRGRSTLFLAAALIRETNNRGVLFSVDHHRGSEEMQKGFADHDASLVDERTNLMDSLPAWRRTIADAQVEDLVVGVIGDSATIGRMWATPASLVFIDGGHGDEVCWTDYRTWSPHVAHGGLLVFHDVFENPNDGGRPPYECYCDALSSNVFVEEPHASCMSLRVLKKVARN